jgi:hypothetical protein
MALELVTDMGFMDHSSFGRSSLFQELHHRFLEWETLMLARRNDVSAIIFALVVIGPATWWALDRQVPYQAEPIGVVPSPVHIGEEVVAEWNTRVLREGCFGTFQRTVTDGANIVWAFQPKILTFTELKIGKYKTRSATPFVLPHGFTCGRSVIYNSITAICNPLQRLFPLHYDNPPLEFDVACN